MKRGVWATILLIASVLALAGTVLLVFVAKIDFVFGYRPIIVTTGSMEPEYRVNSLALVQQADYDDINVGDVVTFTNEEVGHADKDRRKQFDKVIMHRVVDVVDGGLVTKGDAMDEPDGAVVAPGQVAGKVVWHTNATADYAWAVQSPGGIIKYIVLPVVIIILLVVAIKLLPNIKRIFLR